MPISISSSAMEKFGALAVGTWQGESATPMVRVASTAFCAMRATSSRFAPLSASAPAAL
jgi:hypothetical protein